MDMKALSGVLADAESRLLRRKMELQSKEGDTDGPSAADDEADEEEEVEDDDDGDPED